MLAGILGYAVVVLGNLENTSSRKYSLCHIFHTFRGLRLFLVGGSQLRHNASFHHTAYYHKGVTKVLYVYRVLSQAFLVLSLVEGSEIWHKLYRPYESCGVHDTFPVTGLCLVTQYDCHILTPSLT